MLFNHFFFIFNFWFIAFSPFPNLILYVHHEHERAWVLICFQISRTPWASALQAPLSIEFFRQEYWSRLSFPAPGDLQFSSVQFLSRVRLFAIPWITAHQASLSITNSWSLFKLMSIKSVMPSNHLILCRPLLLLPPNPSQHQGLFQWVNSSHEVAKVLEFQLQHQSFQWTPRTDLL